MAIICTTQERDDVKFVDKAQIDRILAEQVALIRERASFSEDMSRALLLKNEWDVDKAIKSITEN